MQPVRTVTFSMKNGDELTVDLSERLLHEIAQTFQIDSNDVGDNHVKYYLASSMKNALELHERSIA